MTENIVRWTAPSDHESRPGKQGSILLGLTAAKVWVVAIIGGGTLGRRIALMWGSMGRPVVLADTVSTVQTDALAFYNANIDAQVKHMGSASAGHLEVVGDAELAVKDAWLVIEAIPERLELKRKLFCQLEKAAPLDAILATNSSSFKSRDLVTLMKDASRGQTQGLDVT
jgi:3-hydroxybutyryl-CoA dehydrogenase